MTNKSLFLTILQFFFNCWWYMVLKSMDLLDTIFLVLMKKNSHITFLHVYHHVSMCFFTWYTMKTNPSFQMVTPGVINAFVHMIMYFYYFLSTLGPSFQKYLYWKIHLTKLQMVQFVAVIAYVFLLIYNNCYVSRVVVHIWLFNVVVILCFFIHFYIKTYTINLKATEVEETKKPKIN